MKTFEEFLADICPCHTNNGPEGYDRWVEQLDIQELIDYADSYGKIAYKTGAIDYIKEKLNENS